MKLSDNKFIIYAEKIRLENNTIDTYVFFGKIRKKYFKKFVNILIWHLKG